MIEDYGTIQAAVDLDLDCTGNCLGLVSSRRDGVIFESFQAVCGAEAALIPLLKQLVGLCWTLHETRRIGLGTLHLVLPLVLRM